MAPLLYRRPEGAMGCFDSTLARWSAAAAAAAADDDDE
jgi:hypothetical protein